MKESKEEEDYEKEITGHSVVKLHDGGGFGRMRWKYGQYAGTG